MIIQKRDLEIFRVVSELGFTTSDNIRKIVSPETKQKTFNLRLSILKKAMFLKEIQGDDRIRNQHSVYSLNQSKKTIEAINTEAGVLIDPAIYNPGYQLYQHQLYLWALFASFLKKLREKVNEFDISKCRIFGSKSIQKELKRIQLHPEIGVDYIDDVMIPDLSIFYGKSVFLFELENTNSYHQFKQKINGYEEMLLKKDSPNFFRQFQWKTIQLIIATRETKRQRYEEILSGYSGKRSLTSIESLTKKK